METQLRNVDTSKRYLVTGAAGFIGFHLSKRLLDEGCFVVGLDNLNSYYDVSLKKARLGLLKQYRNFRFVFANLEDRQAVHDLFSCQNVQKVIHLAAQAGVRYSLEDPHTYVQSNVVGFLNILEECRLHGIEHLVFASSSSVYGANQRMPFSTSDNVDHPISLYAATKKANELMAHTYSHLYGLPTTGLRFFTVYGPWGRPDMALFLFTKAILDDQPIKVFNGGDMKRDFTYIDDIVEGVVRVIANPPQPNRHFDLSNPDPGSSYAPYKIYNIGSSKPIRVIDFIGILEGCLNKKAIKDFLPLQKGDVLGTYADIDDLVRDVGFRPETPLEEGIQRFVDWFKSYYGYA